MTFLRSIGQSLHSPFFYQRIFRDVEGGIGLGYLIKLLILCWVLVSVMLAYLVLEARKNPEGSALMLPIQILRKVSPQFPLVTIEKGKVAVVGTQPMTLIDPETGLNLMIIDTTGSVNALEEGNKASILLTRSAIKMRYEGEDILYEIPAELSLTIDSGKLEEWADFMERMMPFAPFIMLPFNVLGSLLGLSLRWLMMGAIAYVALKPKLNHTKFGDCLRIAAYALTGSILLKMTMIGSGFQPFGSPEMVIIAMTLLYLYFAVTSILRQRSKQLLLPPR